MRLLLALDSRPSNQAAIGILDPHAADWEHFEIMPIAEPFKRRGFRGCTLVGDRLYVLSSAALYIYRAEVAAGTSQFELLHTTRRPEWEVGERAAADLHHLHYSPHRDRLFIANSFMDSVDELTPEGEFIAHHYLWDISPAVAEVARQRNPDATDLVHVNHITEHDGRIYLTCGNWNGTRTGKVICFDTGEIVLEDVSFPHDGFVHGGDFYISATGASEVLIYENAGNMDLLARRPDHILPVEIRQKEWENSFQWVRGIHVSGDYMLCGVTQWRNETADQPQIPPRLVCFDRHSKQFQGELFLPSVEEFPSPSIFTLLPLPDERDVQFDFRNWERQVPRPRQPADSTFKVFPNERSTLAASIPSRESGGSGIWPGNWIPYQDPGVEEQAQERLVGITLPKIDVTSRMAEGWSYVQSHSKEVHELQNEDCVCVFDRMVFYTGGGFRNFAPESGMLPAEHFLHFRFCGKASQLSKLGCDLYCWHDDDKRPQIQEIGQLKLTKQSGEFGLWAYLVDPASAFRIVFRMYQPHSIVLTDFELSLYAALPDSDRLGRQASSSEDVSKTTAFPYLSLLPRWAG